VSRGTGKVEDTVLDLRGISKRFGALVANDSIDLALKRGEVLALLGENGAGKTTLMNILFGHYVADEGEVHAFGRPLPPGNPHAALAAGIGMVHQHFTLADNLSALDNIVLGTEPLLSLGRGRAAARAKVAALAREFGLAIDADARAGSLTVGERQRVEILKALYRDARILILDEPTAVLTPQETGALFATLRKAVAQGLSIIFISHKLREVMAIADRCMVLRHGRKVGEVRTADTSREALAALMVGDTPPEQRVMAGVAGPALLRLDGVSTPDRGAAPGLKHVSLTLHAGQITGLAGVSGNGQAALADLIGGLARPASGLIEISGAAPAAWSPRAALAAGVGRIPEDRHRTGTIGDFTLTENAVLEGYAGPGIARAGFMDWRAAEAFARRIIADYDVRCSGPSARVRLLSGGNMQKMILGRVLEAGPRIILANQPVQGLDVGAIAYVHGRLVAARDEGAAVLLISEDLDEVMGLSDVIHVISGGRLSPAFARGTMGQADLGLWMAGHGFEGAHAA
jgi:general nucleoside transport system ATP-binding protein